MEAGTASIGRAGPQRAWRWLRRNALRIYAALAVLYLLVPIAVIAVFSFAETPRDRLDFSLSGGFTLEYWQHAFSNQELTDALFTSLRLALLATIASTAIGTLMALALVRYDFFGRRGANLLIILPMATPEIVMGASLLALFLNRNVATGFATILIAHIMFNISYVVVTVKARLVGFDRHLEEAAMDLGATPWMTFRKVTLPLIAPGIMAAALIAFALSVDDFVITYFNAGSETTFPLFVWGAARVAVPPQINVIGSMIFLVAIVLMFANIVLQRRRGREGSPVPAHVAVGAA